MYCKNCGNELKENEAFCGMCGTKVAIDDTSDISQNSNLNINNQNFNRKNNKRKNNISFVIGIVSLILVFIFQIFTIPLSVIGIVLGILALKENKKNKIGLILNIISLILAIPLFIFYSNILESTTVDQAVGTWDCKKFDGAGVGSDYVVTMQLNNDNEFIWNKYNDAKNNHVIGTYEFVDLHKTNNDKNINYYQLTLNGEEFVNNGELQNEIYKSKYEMGIFKDTNEAFMMNVNTYNMYYCYKSDKTSAKIVKDIIVTE